MQSISLFASVIHGHPKAYFEPLKRSISKATSLNLDLLIKIVFKYAEDIGRLTSEAPYLVGLDNVSLLMNVDVIAIR